MRKLPNTFRMPIFGLIMAISISCTLSGIFTFYVLDLIFGNIHIWLSNWSAAFCIAVPVAVAVHPLAQWVSGRLTED